MAVEGVEPIYHLTHAGVEVVLPLLVLGLSPSKGFDVHDVLVPRGLCGQEFEELWGGRGCDVQEGGERLPDGDGMRESLLLFKIRPYCKHT